MWFFVGIERVGMFLAIEMSSKALAVAGTIWLVNQPGDAWVMLALQALASAVTVALGMAMVYTRVAFLLPSVSETLSSLRDGWSMFVYYLSSSMYSMSNTIILGILAPSYIVGFYAGAERISRVLSSKMHPKLVAMFPRASGLAHNNREAAAQLARTSTFIVFTVALVNSVILYLMAPFIVRVILGPGYGESVTVLRILLVLLPIVGVSIPLSLHWMIPNGLDRLLTRITISGGLLHVPLAVFLGSQYSLVGIAWALVVTESYILMMIVGTLVVRGLGPFRLPVPKSETGTA
jgi:polysaccharide transporter, PST family